MRHFLAELRRRKVIRVVVAYVIAAFVVIQAADPLVDLLLLPEWTLRLIFALALLGLPVAVGLAWAFDWGPEGLERTPGSPSALGSVPTSWKIAVAGAVVVLAGAGAAFVTWGDGGPDLVENRVLVLPLQNATGDPEMNAVGRMAADWIVQGVVQAELGQVVPLDEAERLVRLSEEDSLAPGVVELAARTGAAYVVTGSLYARGDSVELQAQVIDGAGGDLLDAVPPVSAAGADPISAVETLQQTVLGLLAARLDRRFGQGTTLADVGIRPPSLDAYRLFAQGFRHFQLTEHEEARRLLKEAAALDSTWLPPRIQLIYSYHNAGDLPAADSMIRLLEPQRARMSMSSRLTFDWIRAWVEGDVPGALRVVREGHAVYGDAWNYPLGLALSRNNYPAESAEVLEGGALGRLPPNWPAYMSVLTSSLHTIGAHKRELRAARRGRELYSDLPVAVFWEARALAALDRPEAAAAVLDAGMTLAPRRGWSPAYAQLRGGLELRRHGHQAAGERALRQALEWYRAADPDTDSRYSIARSHLWLGEVEEAIPLFEALAAETPDDVARLGYLGLALARAGHEAEAREIDARLEAWPDPYARGSHLLWQAAITAELGQRSRAVALLRSAIACGVSYADLHESEMLRPLWEYPPFRALIEPKG